MVGRIRGSGDLPTTISQTFKDGQRHMTSSSKVYRMKCLVTQECLGQLDLNMTQLSGSDHNLFKNVFDFGSEPEVLMAYFWHHTHQSLLMVLQKTTCTWNLTEVSHRLNRLITSLSLTANDHSSDKLPLLICSREISRVFSSSYYFDVF